MELLRAQNLGRCTIDRLEKSGIERHSPRPLLGLEFRFPDTVASRLQPLPRSLPWESSIHLMSKFQLGDRLVMIAGG